MGVKLGDIGGESKKEGRMGGVGCCSCTCCSCSCCSCCSWRRKERLRSLSQAPTPSHPSLSGEGRAAAVAEEGVTISSVTCSSRGVTAPAILINLISSSIGLPPSRQGGKAMTAVKLTQTDRPPRELLS
ncbi:uncharacterized protein BO95DRAFT_253528 [Aspergillus brunneoviolaceus CBS 621.78]|uniref:Uncharacterized protein n=1 Tax=Aspergillus brunneoviolaceus CBS 621.78 TaxID=1450534 RepID=A0ACD1FYM8_9EURO|nr:hypothetical protein BO95DRAFT_253528 [Aspergillus brunneoviolaceus CBS 621.78]RAH42016.1 hypothetical protein BO95DRAFT_253528 [Aspergillus brunneoviolaceus CBS 621.78]